MKKRRHNTTPKIAAWIAKIRLQDIPGPVQRCAKEHLLDGFATMVAGTDEEAIRQIDRHLRNLGGKPEATVVGTRIKAPAQHAALANGVRGHVLDYDDTQLATLRTRPFGQLTHPTTPVLAAAAALAEKIRASGSELLSAYVVGVEIACRLCRCRRPASLSRRVSPHRHPGHVRRRCRLRAFAEAGPASDYSRPRHCGESRRGRARSTGNNGEGTERRARCREWRDGCDLGAEWIYRHGRYIRRFDGIF